MIDCSTTVDMIYLDFSKAFDKVGHGIVLHKLRDFGITGNLGVCFHQFLSDRTQFVRLPGRVSKDQGPREEKNVLVRDLLLGPLPPPPFSNTSHICR